MKHRVLGKTGYSISEIALGTWQLGSKWGMPFDEEEALKILEEAYSLGINFIDTADVYKDGLSEKVIGKFLKTKKDKIYVVTKCGRKLKPHISDLYTKENIFKFVEDSLTNMQLEQLDLILLHCPPTDAYYKEEMFLALDELKRMGKIAHYGVSVEKVEEAILASKYDISAVEIIFNMFRQKPVEEFFKIAKEKNIGIIARVPLASGLLTGSLKSNQTFDSKDHRTYNRNGESFDKGETFSGVDYETGIKASEELKRLFNDENLTKYALKWILMHDEVSTVIPGASKTGQITENAKASDFRVLTDNEMEVVKTIYDKYIKRGVHGLW